MSITVGPTRAVHEFKAEPGTWLSILFNYNPTACQNFGICQLTPFQKTSGHILRYSTIQRMSPMCRADEAIQFRGKKKFLVEWPKFVRVICSQSCGRYPSWFYRNEGEHTTQCRSAQSYCPGEAGLLPLPETTQWYLHCLSETSWLWKESLLGFFVGFLPHQKNIPLVAYNFTTIAYNWV